MMAHGMKPLLAEKGADHPFRRVQPLLEKADIVFGNLENPVGARGKRFPDKDFHFLMDPPHAAALQRAGFRVVSLANNHVLDFGPTALEDTRRQLETLGIKACGAGNNLAEARRPAVVAAGRRSVAFLAYSRTFPLAFSATEESPGTAFAETAFLREDIPRAKAAATWVVVSFHWGKEYTEVPSRALRRLAHAAIDAGADAVVGHHPHRTQGFEVYKGKIIAYSLGNFVFGTRNPDADVGVLLKLFLEPDRPPRAEIFPLRVDNLKVDFQPHPLRGEEARQALARLNRLSRRFRTRLRPGEDRALIP